MQAGTQFTNSGEMECRVNLINLIVHRLGVKPATFHESDAEPLHDHDKMSLMHSDLSEMISIWLDYTRKLIHLILFDIINIITTV